jgi:TPR repeat protein
MNKPTTTTTTTTTKRYCTDPPDPLLPRPLAPTAVFRAWEAKAKLGEAEAQHVMGSCYLTGSEGVEKNVETAMTWFKLGAAQNHRCCLYHVGQYYYHLQPATEPNFATAAKYFTLAAQGNAPAAQARLGAMYMAGTGVPRNWDTAEKWLRAATSANEHQIQANALLGLMLMREPQRAKHADEMIQVMTSISKAGHMLAFFGLGIAHTYGIGVPVNLSMGFQMFVTGALKGCDRSCNVVGCIYMQNDVVSFNPFVAFHWFNEAIIANAKNVFALHNLGLCHLTGQGTPRNLDLGIQFLKKAVAFVTNSCSMAHYTLGLCYELGHGVEKNIPLALKYYQTAQNVIPNARAALARLKSFVGVISAPPRFEKMTTFTSDIVNWLPPDKLDQINPTQSKRPAISSAPQPSSSTTTTTVPMPQLIPLLPPSSTTTSSSLVEVIDDGMPGHAEFSDVFDSPIHKKSKSTTTSTSTTH